MAKFLALLLTTAAALGLVQAQCPANAVLCGTTIVDTLQCAPEGSLVFITPAGNDPRNCAFHTNEDGLPQGRGAFCCAEGRCFQNGLQASCD
ncbi:hypothetical protein NEMBOFW57_006860 [Staphylotrichum longicolle]|uniref:Plethodontid modulating factor n=1 Tax=Staphylotrichum longicolle TaxID=669026 RepID=A0AAD4EU26_9PEZI|nr:hypothetical protein NEMBOFW57_006860 [Staphylotrichum longicolle]